MMQLVSCLAKQAGRCFQINEKGVLTETPVHGRGEMRDKSESTGAKRDGKKILSFD